MAIKAEPFGAGDAKRVVLKPGWPRAVWAGLDRPHWRRRMLLWPVAGITIAAVVGAAIAGASTPVLRFAPLGFAVLAIAVAGAIGGAAAAKVGLDVLRRGETRRVAAKDGAVTSADPAVVRLSGGCHDAISRPQEVAIDPLGSKPGAQMVERSTAPGAQTRVDDVMSALVAAPTDPALQPFFADAPVGIGVIDALGCFTKANRALGELFDAGPETLIGRGLIALLNPEDRAAVAARLADAALGREDRSPVEIRLAPPSERTMVLLLNRFDNTADADLTDDARPMPAIKSGPDDNMASPAGADRTRSLTLYFIDVTEQKQLETHFAQSQKMQAVGQFAGGVAHDFNNLLTAMIGFCDLLLLRSRPGDPAFADIMQIKQNANRAANLVRQLLAFSRQQTLQPRVLDITDVLAELSHLLRRLIGENIELEFVHGRDLGLVKVDQGQLEQVVINLAVNARDAMPEGGRLTIRTQRSYQPRPVRRGTEIMPAGDYVLIEVTDTGVGIAPDTLARIFEPFFSTKEVGSGTGLGLSTVYGIVKQTGGFIFVESCPGRGTIFSIYLPGNLAADAPPREIAEAEPAIARDLTGSGTIMLVEDDDAVRMFGARALRNKGYRVIEAKNGESALAMIRDAADPIDLVITDVVMPQLDGPALVRELRDLDCHIKVIFISGYAEDGFRQRLDQERDIHFLPKPFDLKQLALKVKEVLRSDCGSSQFADCVSEQNRYTSLVVARCTVAPGVK